jgi:RNA polymerase-binding transcription factor DksA
MLKLKSCHSPLTKDFSDYEGDPDAAALETSIKSEFIGSVQQALTYADDDILFSDCLLCRQPIAEQRLKQLPWSTYCGACDPIEREQESYFKLRQAA